MKRLPHSYASLPILLFRKAEILMPRVLVSLFQSTLRKCRNYARELPSLLLFFFHSHNALLPPTLPPRTEPSTLSSPRTSVASMLPRGLRGIQLSEVCGLRLGLSGSSVGPLKLPYLHALKPI